MTIRSPWTCILWDVDGTVVDASEGILRRLTICLEHFGLPAPKGEELVHWIGPPLYDSFQANVGMTGERTVRRWTGFGQRVLGVLFVVGMVLFVAIIWMAL